MKTRNPLQELLKAYKGEEALDKFLHDAVLNYLAVMTAMSSIAILHSTKGKDILYTFCEKLKISTEHVLTNDTMEELNRLTLKSINIAAANIFVEFDKNKNTDWENIIKNDPNQKEIYEELSQDPEKWKNFLNTVKAKNWTIFFEKQEKVFLQSKEGQAFRRNIEENYLGSYFLNLLQSLSKEIYADLARQINKSESETTKEEEEAKAPTQKTKGPTIGFMPWTNKITRA